MAYEDIDATSNVFDLRKNWAPHEGDFQADAMDFLWQGEKGKNLLGAIHYLASEELNVFSFLTFNVDGDDQNVYPYLLKVSEDEYQKEQTSMGIDVSHHAIGCIQVRPVGTNL